MRDISVQLACLRARVRLERRCDDPLRVALAVVVREGCVGRAAVAERHGGARRVRELVVGETLHGAVWRLPGKYSRAGHVVCIRQRVLYQRTAGQRAQRHTRGGRGGSAGMRSGCAGPPPRSRSPRVPRAVCGGSSQATRTIYAGWQQLIYNRARAHLGCHVRARGDTREREPASAEGDSGYRSIDPSRETINV